MASIKHLHKTLIKIIISPLGVIIIIIIIIIIDYLIGWAIKVVMKLNWSKSSQAVFVAVFNI